MRLPVMKLLFPALCALATLGVAQAPHNAFGCWFGCCNGGCQPYAAGRMWTPARVGYGQRMYYSAPFYVNSDCGSCGQVATSGCGTCGDAVYGSSSGDCQASPAAAVTPANPSTGGVTPADPKDRWKKKTYDEEEAPLGGSSAGTADDRIRGSAGAGAAGAGAAAGAADGTATPPADGAAGSRGGIKDEGEETERTTMKPESPAPAPGGTDADGERVKIEPRSKTKAKSSAPAPAEIEDASDETKEDPKDNKSGGLSLPQASRLDHVVATREAPVRERVSLKKPARSGHLVRVAEYPKTPWNQAEPAATVARSK
ncbi:MAG: hypothetical protein NT069_11550 [Planctomycetota bacterium]|nr:hypothetical protein [Planctomycetota bacterium]